MRRYRTDMVALSVILIATLILFRDAILRGWVFYEYDTSMYYLPLAHWVGDAIAQGHVPLWSQYIYAGFPLFADGEGSVFYPPNVLLLALLSPERAFICSAVLHFFLAGASTYIFLRVLQPNRIPALIAGLTFALGSFMVTQMHHVNVVQSAAWLPLILAFAELALRSTGRRRVLCAALGGLAFGLQLLTMHVQPVLMTVLALGFVIAFHVLWSGTGAIRRTMGGIAVGVSIVITGLALSAVQLLPLAELAGQSARENATYEFGSSFGPALPDLITLVFPYFFRFAGYDYWTLWFRWETTIYVGIAPFVLAVIGSTLVRSRQTLLFSLLAMISLLLALGDYSPLNIYGLWWHLPYLSFLRAPGRFSMLFVFSIAVLAGLGTQHVQGRLAPWRSQSHRHAFSVVLVSLAAFALALVAGLVVAHGWLVTNKDAAMTLISDTYLTLRHQPGIQYGAEDIYNALRITLDWRNGRTGLSLVLLPSTLLLVTFWWRSRTNWVWQALLVPLVAFDLLAFAVIYHPQTPIGELARPKGAAEFLAARTGLYRTYSQQVVGPTVPNRMLSYGVAAARGYSSLEGRRYRRYLQAVQQGNTNLLDLWNVRYVVTSKAGTPPGPREEYVAVFEDSYNVVYENASYLPRAFVAADAVVVDSGSAAIQIIAQRQFDARRHVVIEVPGQASIESRSQTLAPIAESPGNAMITVYDANQVVIEAQADVDSYLVLDDSYYPGWDATIDGRPIAILRADYLFRAIPLPKGHHTVVFTYEPFSFKMGALMSASSLLILLAVLAYCVLPLARVESPQPPSREIG